MLRQQFKCPFSGQQKVAPNEAKTVCEWRGAHACGSVSSQRTTANSCTLLHDEPPPCFDVLLVPCCPQFIQISSSWDKLEQKRPQGSLPPHIQRGSKTGPDRVGSAPQKVMCLWFLCSVVCVQIHTYSHIFQKNKHFHTYIHVQMYI